MASCTVVLSSSPSHSSIVVSSPLASSTLHVSTPSSPPSSSLPSPSRLWQQNNKENIPFISRSKKEGGKSPSSKTDAFQILKRTSYECLRPDSCRVTNQRAIFQPPQTKIAQALAATTTPSKTHDEFSHVDMTKSNPTELKRIQATEVKPAPLPLLDNSTKIIGINKKKQPCKKRSTTDSSGKQTKIKRLQVTKLQSNKEEPVKGNAEKSCPEKTIKKHKSTIKKTNKSGPRERPGPAARMDLQLQEAIKRRANWTPIRDTTILNVDEQASGSKPDDDVQQPQVDFAALMTEFGLSKDSGAITKSAATNDPAFRRTIKIDLIPGQGPMSIGSDSTRPRAIKKRPLTITERAVAPYQAHDILEPDLLLASKEGPIDPPQTIAETRTRTKPKATRKATIRNPSPELILLSPETAFKKVQRQDFVFGTSSQLLSGDSAAETRELCRAQNASELEYFREMNGQSPTRDTLGFRPTKSLWSAAAQPEEQRYCETPATESMTIVREDEPDATATKSPSPSSVIETTAKAKAMPPPEQGQRPSSRSPIQACLVQQPIMSQKQGIESKLEGPNECLTIIPSQEAPEEPVRKCSPDMPSSEMPNFKGFTTDQLRKAIAAYRFKKIGKRDTMISVLEKCWHSQQASAAQRNMVTQVRADGDNAELAAARQVRSEEADSAPNPTRPNASDVLTTAQVAARPVIAKKPRGRPRKTEQSAAKGDKRIKGSKAATKKKECLKKTDDIDDSDAPTPSPSSRQKKSGKIVPLTLSPSHRRRKRSESIGGGVEDRQPEVTKLISKAINAEPPTHNMSKLSWKEQMLMYDPIVIEDLTAWLNRTGLQQVDEDHEVSVHEVKAWCEANSICCLSRDNLKGGARSRW